MALITVKRNPRTKKYIAQLTQGTWGFWREADTREEAVRSLEEAIVSQVKNLSRHTYIYTNEGTIIVLFYSDGWGYDMVRPTKSGIVRAPSACLLGHNINEHAALQEALHHANSAFGGVRTVESQTVA